jgi:hypothetical protein
MAQLGRGRLASAVDSGESAGIVPSLQHAGKRQPLPKGLLDSLNMAEALV